MNYKLKYVPTEWQIYLFQTLLYWFAVCFHNVIMTAGQFYFIWNYDRISEIK